MQVAIRGTYQNGQISLNELPPIDKTSEVMVVFLSEFDNPKPKTASLFGIEKNNAEPKINKRQKQLGILSDYKADPAFFEPLDKDELEKW